MSIRKINIILREKKQSKENQKLTRTKHPERNKASLIQYCIENISQPRYNDTEEAENVAKLVVDLHKAWN